MDDQSLQAAQTHAQRGTALLVSGALLVVLKWLVPYVAPFAVAAYGLYALYHRRAVEGCIALGVAALLWLLRVPLAGLFWLVGAAMAGVGLFFLIRGMRA